MNRTFACSDIHGMLDLWKQISNYCDDSDTIYFLGDAIDRGKESMQVLLFLLNDKRVKYIKGNHEDIFVNLIENPDSMDFLLKDPTYNGIKDFLELDLQIQIEIYNKLSNLPIEFQYINKNNQKIILNHSGFFTKESIPLEEKYQSYLWDRDHIFKGLNKWDLEENTFIVHGHTPVQTLYRDTREKPNYEIFFYCEDHKIDLDLASFMSKKIALFNLDTLMIEKYFEVGD